MTNERYLKIVRLDSWASSDIGEEMSQFSSHSPYSVGWVDRRLFHSDSATVSQCDNFCCYRYLLCLKLYMTSQRWRGFFFFFGFFFGGGGRGALISSVFSLVFGVVYWSRPPRVLRRFTALLLDIMSHNARNFDLSFNKSYLVHGDHFMFNWQLKCTSDVSDYTTKVFFAWLYLMKTLFANVCIHRMHVRDHARHILRALSRTLGTYFSDPVMPRCDWHCLKS